MQQKFLSYIFVFFVAASSLLNSTTAKAQSQPQVNPAAFIPGALPAFYWTTTSGTSVGVGERVLVSGYFINDGNNEIPAGAVLASLSWSSSYLAFDGWADPATGADIAAPVGYTELYHDDGSVYIECDEPLADGMGTWVQVAFYVKGVAVHDNNTFLARLEPTDPPRFDQAKTIPQRINLNVTPKVLPITLSSFTAQKQAENSALLKWNIKDAKNFSHFELERSSTGRQFSKIASIAFDEKKAAYTYTDENLQTGSYQYRLKMVDIDGKMKYSEVRSLNFDGSVNERVYLAPNPTKGEFFVRGLTATAIVRVLDINGKTLQTYNGVNAYTTLNIAQLPAAVYLVQVIEDGKFGGTFKLVKE